MRNAIILATLVGLFGPISAVQASNDNLAPAVQKSQELQKYHDRHEHSDVRSEHSDREHEAHERSDRDSHRHDNQDGRS